MENNKNSDIETFTMYQLFARMFAHVAKSVVDRFGEEGEEAIKAGVRAFGEERGRNIAARAKARGDEINAHTYLPNYDMDRSNDFASEDTYGDNQVEQLFTKCIFAEQWMNDGMQKYGLLYCDVIDPAIAHGFSENLKCVHEKHFFKDGVCTFCFKMTR